VKKEWTKEEFTRTCELWNEGSSFSEIGKVLGRSKGSIAGMVNRLQQQGLLEARNDAQLERRVNLRKPASKPKKAHKTLLDEPPEEPPPPDPRASFMAQRDGLCRWPEGNAPPFQFCLKPTRAQQVYCPEHWQRSIQRKYLT
jgi:hypothetical protein